MSGSVEGSLHRAWGTLRLSRHRSVRGDGGSKEKEEEEEEDVHIGLARGWASGPSFVSGSWGAAGSSRCRHALCHQRHLALCPGCVLGVITCPFKFWELSLTGAEVYLLRLLQLPCSPGPPLPSGGPGAERHLLRVFHFHEKRASWEGPL